MATRILLVRHGETKFNDERRCQGFTDVPLNERGVAQAVNLAEALKKERIDAIISSDLVRAKKTAEHVAVHHGLSVQLDARLRELNQGSLEGKNLDGLLSDHPELLKNWMDRPADVEMPGGESMRALQARAWRAVEDVLEAFPDKTVVIVAHNLCIMSIVCLAIGLDLNNFRRLKIGTASISEIRFSNGGPTLIKINDSHHIDR